MIVAVYATLGVFLVLAARDPIHHLSLISFTIWSSVVHGLVMAVQSVVDPVHLHHLYGDVLALFLVAAVLASLAAQGLRIKIGRLDKVEKPALESDFDQYPEKPGDFLNIVTPYDANYNIKLLT